MWTALDDLTALPGDLRSAIQMVGGSKLKENMNLMDEYITLTGFTPSGCSFRKITWFPDKEDKMRVIAI
jgi:hypothetical protein